MALCTNQSASFTDTDLTADYAVGGQSGLLVGANLSAAAREDNGLLTPQAVKAAVQSLITAGLVPVPPVGTDATNQERIQVFMRKDKTFLEDVSREYCFYDARYKYSLRQLIGKLQAGYTDSNSQSQALIKKYLQFSQTLNRKLNDMTQIVSGITQSRVEATQGRASSIQGLSGQLEQRSKLLAKQSKVLSSEEGAANLYKDMTRYTKQKVDTVNNMLALYSVLNITALGLLFYLYSAMSE